MEGRVIAAGDLTTNEAAVWDRLCRETRSLASPFMSPHYTRAVASVRSNVFVCVLTRGADPVGFLPFQFRSRLHRLLRAAEPVGQEMTDYFGLVAQPGLGLDEQRLLKFAGLQVLHFSYLDETQLEYGLPGEKPEVGYLMRLDRAESYWEMLRRTHKEFVLNTERRQRQVEREFGPLRFTPMESQWRAPLANLVECKERQYTKTGKNNLFAVRWKRQLLEELAGYREATCTGILSTLYAGDRWLASHFGLRGGNILHYCFPVYNPEMARYGPGRLLLKALIESAPELGLDVIDHGAGEARYKQECSNDRHQYYRGAWHTASIRSVLGRMDQGVRWRAERLREMRDRKFARDAKPQQ